MTLDRGLDNLDLVTLGVKPSVALLSVDLVESVDLVSVVLVVNCTYISAVHLAPFPRIQTS